MLKREIYQNRIHPDLHLKRNSICETQKIRTLKLSL
jgi:hypothetical protein